MREKFLSTWGKISAKHAYKIIIVAIILTVIFGYSAQHLEMTMRWSDLLPMEHPKVKEYDNIIREYESASNSIIVIQGDTEKIKAFADDIAPKIRSLKTYVKRVDYKIEKEFLKNHGFMLTKKKNLKNMTDTFQNLSLIPLLTHINDNFEKTYIGDEESLSTQEKRDNSITYLDGIAYWLKTMEKYVDAEAPSPALAETAVERFLLGDPYFISYDKKMVLMMVEPTFPATATEMVLDAVAEMQTVIDETLKDHPGVDAGMTGLLPLIRDETYYGIQDAQFTSTLAFILILILFIVSFRMWTAPLLAGVNLLIGIIWAAGIGSFFLDSLNIMTSMFAVILMGLGIDFSIHIISIYSEFRAKGKSRQDAMTETLIKAGGGIITGGLTTSLAFFTLMISKSRGIHEMGLILGIGVISCLLSSILILPAILITREKLLEKIFKRKETVKPNHIEFKFLGNLAVKFSQNPLLFIGIGVVLTGFLLYQAITVEFDYNYLNMEPEGIDSVELQHEMVESFDLSPDFVMVTAETVEKVREIEENAKEIPTVRLVDAISQYIPSDEEQKVRRPYVLEIRTYLTENTQLTPISDDNFERLIAELERLDMNIYELSQMAFLAGQDKVDRKAKQLIGDPADTTSTSYILALADKFSAIPDSAIPKLNQFQTDYEPPLRNLALEMANPEEITLNDIPQNIKDKYMNESGDRFLITISPNEQVWDFEFLRRFDKQMARVSDKITGMPVLFLDLVDYIGRDGKIATILTIIVVFILLLIDFGSVRYALMAMIPLVFGAVWMVGLLNLFGMKLTFVNVIAIPMIVGIGIDDGVHLLHRYKVEGKGKIYEVVASTGKAIMLTSLTTMIGFGVLLLAKYRGFGSMGSLLVLGVGACFVTTVLFLPSILGWKDRKVGW